MTGLEEISVRTARTYDVPRQGSAPAARGGYKRPFDLALLGLALVLLTPLVTAPWTLYPFSVGKALYARVLIAAVFGLWAVRLASRDCTLPSGCLTCAFPRRTSKSALKASHFGTSTEIDLDPHRHSSRELGSRYSEGLRVRSGT